MPPATTSRSPRSTRHASSRLSCITRTIKYHVLGKIEADEIVPSLRRLASARRGSGQPWCRGLRPSNTPPTSDAEESSQTPVDPFHLQNLSRRILSSGVGTAPAADQVSVASLTDADAPPEAVASAPVPPPLPPQALGASRGALASCFAPSTNDDAILLHSTPYTMNMLTFRHGRINVPKSGSLVAILGGAGDLYSGSTEPMRRSDDELEDIVNWFGEFGFESPGRARARQVSRPGLLHI
ncbi:hypothetical protein B0T11DRAFT_344560 [Plectosphaerella cucumerina]|uniref:Uncharacterized protein n=1 Tax=Plectosphaerella cucumerina TaxID=40658 RepID=A0A8K0TLY0_9PEZI|nr:hypothetical protein B0T11DRAFT_344560 [Plectosphaerella cucumerina]